ncbi:MULTISPECIES: class I ribonucleotide reductase maintenance protein YfaE [Photorhabdus]|uniref:(2Fe-2S)-binding protein n=5 Tax=Photorhabdus TaxID=29487 RepID=A0A0F7LRS7_9GAMM|nr:MULTISPECIES: class I ribonucleotide reductase maintenance protein YfaE [Photorhabdus]AKH64683.1 (2Fe-2S)-binding protein [Photorhabdus thracensis]EQB99566.1 hypothetical protein B738_16998 [Photorhabdus temperata subsp. temperata M1021]ERT12822.1 (2Fe-2S)-binding protein [Photorhabdus temperata J3]KER01771.1 ferredoxin [Photorhabdus temperata subsp. temperata Meg1]MCC8420145.1 2Fe-2S ferredoxin-like protein [Photorhabdus thracensis]
MTSYKVTLHGMQGYHIHSSPELHNSLLEALEQGKVQAEYQCREGYCGSCRVRLVKGKVGYRRKPLAFVNEGEILPCCCHPLSDIEIEL